ncbi:MAG: hypothetical protein US31_C0006G0028 [Berkelbacteria bacterium GW2011_GWA1_36_9]|uniref:Uncharacterized protein n=1 Tax=Berkelbacteria bacterium GW2011_GWA1_36_9 TaxID=1618331 RepID=A0A0G0FKL6_9BACT|nr:MAG: hypothetical protein US31_C0006G0028 [Berkelbacteria bacterium GW2011_GWA1_36_9]
MTRGVGVGEVLEDGLGVGVAVGDGEAEGEIVVVGLEVVLAEALALWRSFSHKAPIVKINELTKTIVKSNQSGNGFLAFASGDIDCVFLKL